LRKTMGKYWFHFKPLEHIYFFAPSTISKLLKLTGFEVIKIKKSGKVVTLQYLINRLKFYSKFIYFLLTNMFEKTSLFCKPFYFAIGEMFVVAKKYEKKEH
jgi:hypothetical protein